ncbi:MAG TPA: multicopper oxidase family protein [Polyangia bacterium]|nr:multicopper oxidase family protein [Polyangia bacterium]
MKHASGFVITVAAPLIFAVACGTDPLDKPQPSGQPAGWLDDIALTPVVDVSPDPGVVEINLDARPASMSYVPGGPTPMWTYGGTVPGPLIRARVGDRVIAHFTNNITEDTTVHWHGIRVPAAMDGMPGQSQPPVPPGGSFDYDFVVPDASTFWYHPHVNSAAQEGNGMYGAFIVDDPNEPAGLGDEVVMVLSDVAVNDDGSLQPPDSAGDFGALFGREGNVLLVNGKVRPTLKARPGLRQRWRFINAAKTRYFQIALDGHTFTRIGGDGGLLTAPLDVAQPEIAPGERMDLLVVPEGKAGDELVVRWIAFDRGYGSTFNRPDIDLFAVRLEGTHVDTPPLPALGRSITPLPTDGASPVDLSLTAQYTTPLILGINGVPYDQSQPLMAYVGDTQVWTITNTIQFAHPFHLHGFFFQVISPVGPLEWKDTVNVPVNGTVKFVVRYDDRPGMWMFHFHILDHAEAGMMGSLMVMEPE